jgi:malonyl-CoA O-methyltransferase
MSSWKISSLTERVRRAFTEAADQYDILASLQREIGRELVKKHIKLPKVHRILDVGCGTGYVAAKAKFFFPESPVVGIDLASGMLEKALEQNENCFWVEGDAQKLPFKSESFDLIYSNLAYQWVGDLAQAFKEARRALSHQSTLAVTLFGRHTCDEFFTALEATGTTKEGLNRLPSVEEVKRDLAQAGFSSVKVDYERIQIQFKDLWDLLAWLKAIGANGLSSGVFLGPQALAEANEYCLKNYPYHDGIRITFEVIWIHAQA